jgi:hypothetical protein
VPVETGQTLSFPIVPDDVLELGSEELRPAAGALSVGYFDTHGVDEIARLHELGIPYLYSVDRESAELQEALGRYYWLRRLWVEEEWPGGRKPDPLRGPVPVPLGKRRHVFGRRRLLP